MATKTPSIGQATALQYRIPISPDFALSEMATRRKEEQDAIDAAKKAQEKSRELIEKHRGELNKILVDSSAGVGKIYHEEVQAAAIDYVKGAQQHKDDPGWWNSIDRYTKESNLNQIVHKRRTDTKNFDEPRQKVVEQPGLFRLNSKDNESGGTLGQDLNQAWEEGNYNKFMEVQRKIQGESATDASFVGFIEPIIKDADWRSKIQKTASGLDVFKTAEGQTYVPSSNAKAAWESIKNSPSYQDAYADYGAIPGIDPLKIEQAIYDNEFKPHINPGGAAPEKGKGGLSFNFGANAAENDDVRVVVSDTEDRRVYDIAQIKSAENSILDFSRPKTKTGETPVVRGTPLRVEKLKKTGELNIVVSVPEIVDKEKTGNFIEERVPYELNKNRVLQGKLGFTVEAIDKGLPERGVEVKEGVKTAAKKEIKKTIKRSDISVRAKASGYTTAEYEKLLKEKGIEITNE